MIYAISYDNSKKENTKIPTQLVAAGQCVRHSFFRLKFEAAPLGVYAIDTWKKEIEEKKLVWKNKN